MDGNPRPQEQSDRFTLNADDGEVQHRQRAVAQHSIERLKRELPGQQDTPRPIRAMPAGRPMMKAAPLVPAPDSRRTTIGGQAGRIRPVPSSAAADNARMFFFLVLSRPANPDLTLHHLLYHSLRFVNRRVPHLLEQFPPLLFSDGLELLLLLLIQERHDFGIDGTADLLQPL